MIRLLASLLLLTPALCGQVSGLSVDASATQAVIHYNVIGGAVCGIEVSTSNTYAPLVKDVDPVLYPGSDSDLTRPNMIGSGAPRRIATIGRRKYALASNGLRYSLALEQSTQHFVRINCGGGNIATTTFITDPPPTGMGYEHPSFDITARWNHNLLSLDYSSAQSVIDPLTGIRLQPISLPGKVGAAWNERTWQTTDFYFARSGSWTNPQNIINGSLATFTTANAAGVIVAPIDPNLTYICGVGGTSSDCAIEDIGYRLIGGADAANTQIGICLTLDSGATCYGNEILSTLPVAAPADLGLKWGANASPSPVAAGWFSSRANLMEKGLTNQWGIGDIVAGAITLTKGYDGNVIGSTTPSLASYFDAGVAVGSKVWIESSSPTCGHNLCTIASIANSTAATISEAVTSSNKNIRFANFGLRLRYVSGTGTASVSFKNYAVAYSRQRRLPAAGGTDQWSKVKITAADGSRGYLGISRDASANFSTLYFLVTDGPNRQQYRVLGVLKPPCSIPGYAAVDLPQCGTGGGPTPEVAIFDSTDGTKMYAPLGCDTGGVKQCQFSITYDLSNPSCGLAEVSGYGYFQGAGLNNLSYPTETCLLWANLTKVTEGRSLTTQIQAVSWYDFAQFGFPTYFGVAGDYSVFYKSLSTQDTLAAFFVFANSNGSLVRSFNTWDGSMSTTATTRVTFTGIHNIDASGIPNYVDLTTNRGPGFASGQAYAGPWQSPISCLYKPAASPVCNAADTSLPPAIDNTYENACPANAFGASGNNCIHFRAKAMPCRTGPTLAEKTSGPCEWDATQASAFSMRLTPGDVFLDIGNPTPGLFDTERFLVILVTDLGGGVYEVWAKRDGAFSYCVASNQLAVQKTHVHGWALAMGIHRYGCDNGLIHLNVATGIAVESPRADVGGHNDYGEGDSSGRFHTLISGAGNGDGIANNLPIASISNLVPHMQLPTWDGCGTDSAGVNATQSYPSVRTKAGQRTALNYRTLNPGFGATDFAGSNIGAVTAVLQGGTASVYKLSVLSTGNYKCLPLHVWAGRYLLGDASSPTLGNTITDATPYRFCAVLNNGECRVGSVQGEVYASVPNADLTGVANVGSYNLKAPSAIWLSPIMGWITETSMDELSGGDRTRRLSMGLSFPGWSEAFSNARMTPGGELMVFHVWTPGHQRQLWSAALGPRAWQSGQSGTTWRKVKIPVAAHSSYTQARVVYGFGEYGTPAQSRCAPYASSCYADGTTLPYAHAAAASWQACNGCELTVYAPPGRVLYWRVERGVGGALKTTTATEALVVR